jgi:hypothetical protein
MKLLAVIRELGANCPDRCRRTAQSAQNEACPVSICQYMTQSPMKE